MFRGSSARMFRYSSSAGSGLLLCRYFSAFSSRLEISAMGPIPQNALGGGAPGCTEAEYAILCGIGGALNASSRSVSNRPQEANDIWQSALTTVITFPNHSTHQ